MDLSGAQGELPMTMHAAASTFAGVGGSSGHGHGHGHAMQVVHQEQHGGDNGQSSQSPAMPPSPPPAAPEEEGHGKKRGAAAGAGIGGAGGGGASSGLRYCECLKNHAAAIGGNATDGCGEFMPAGEEGSLEALKCSACGCHRNFHRKEVDDDGLDLAGGGCASYGHRAARRLLAPAMAHHHKNNGGAGGGGLMVAAADPYGAYAPPPPPPAYAQHPHHQFVMPLSIMHTSESDEMDGAGAAAFVSGSGGGGGSSSSKKRFRTKFTAEQKARMLEFAERVGWRLQKLDDAMVQAFCHDIGVKRRVLKVWMHNNKHNLATKPLLDASPPPMPALPPSSSSPPPQMPMQMAVPMMPASQPGPPPSSSCHLGHGSQPELKLQ